MATTAPRRSGAEGCADQVLEVVPAVMDALRGSMRQHVGEQLSVPQFRCLNFIAQTPGASVSAVAAFLGVTLPTASAMVDRLSRAGAIQPSEDPQDRRRQRLHLTAAGRAQLGRIRRDAHADLSHTLARQPVEDLQTLQAGLAVLRRLFCPDAP